MKVKLPKYLELWYGATHGEDVGRSNKGHNRREIKVKDGESEFHNLHVPLFALRKVNDCYGGSDA